MEKQDLRIVYMGTPEFAVESLRRLVEGGYNVVGVVTMPDKPMGRHGSVLQASPVKQYAESKGLKVLQPVRLKDEGFVEELRSLRADLQIVVAFRMLPEVVWSMPPLGTFNLHASLLPQYRGAAPINWAVINGDTETGITTFFLQHEIDTGQIIQQVRVPIADTDNVGIVHDKLMMLGGQLVVETVDNILSGTVKAIPQEQFMKENEELRPAPKIFKDTCRMDWSKPLKQVYDFVPSGNTFLSSAGTGFEAVVYPNPVSDHVNVCCPSASHSSPCVLNILDNRGKRVGEHILQQAETRLDLSDFPSGLYMFVFLTEKGQVRAFRKVVKAGC